jgi:hypothetical protein
MLDEAELERTLDLWSSMWLAEERVQFERALERVVDGEAAEALKAVAVAACHIIGTPRLVAAAERSWWFMEESTLDAIEAVVEPRARIMRHAARLAHDRAGIAFLLDKAVRDPGNPVADKLLDRIDIRDLYAVMCQTFDDARRAEAGRRLARRGPHQRARLLAALDLPTDVFDEQLAIDVPIDDFGDGIEDGIEDGAWLPIDVELTLSA